MEANSRHKPLYRKKEIRKKFLPEKQKLAQVFPEEIWMLILTYHSYSVDLRNVAQSSQYFETLLFPRRSQWLFPFVWQLIAANFVTQNMEQFNQWLKSVLTLRFVCKTWSKAVDLTFERLLSNYEISREVAFDQNPMKFADMFCLNIYPRWEDLYNYLMDFFETTHLPYRTRSPIISKVAVVSMDSADMFDADSSWVACLKVLSAYGKLIRHCRMSSCFYEHFSQSLALMPNLQTLSVETIGTWRQDNDAHAELEKWNKYLLPRLPHLKVLDVKHAQHKPVLNLINVCSSLSSFKYHFDHQGFDITGLLIHPLEQLKVCINVTSYAILTTRPYSWPLTHLELSFEETCFVEWPELFAWFHQKWNETLKRLNLAFPRLTRLRHVEQIVEWSFMPLLKLEKLTHLTLTLNSLHTLDFILPVSKTLEHLSLTFGTFGCSLEGMQNQFVEDFREMKEKQKLKILGYLQDKNLSSSNIWTLFPNLKEVHHRNYGYKFLSISRPIDGNC